MSMARCSKCGNFVDTDDDPDCYGIDGDGFGKYELLCEECREELEAELELSHE